MQEDMQLMLPGESRVVEPAPMEIRILRSRNDAPFGEVIILWDRNKGEPVRLYLDEFEHLVPKAKPSTLRERLNEVIDERRARQGDVPHQPITPPANREIDTPGWWRDRRHLALGATGLATGLEAMQRCLMTMRVVECGRVFMHDGEQDRVLIHDPEAVLDAAMEAFAAYFGTEPFPTPAPYHGANINWPVVREAMLKALTAANEASSPKVL